MRHVFPYMVVLMFFLKGLFKIILKDKHGHNDAFNTFHIIIYLIPPSITGIKEILITVNTASNNVTYTLNLKW